MPFGPGQSRFRGAPLQGPPPKRMPPPPPPVPPKQCRYHPERRACAAVYARLDWVLLCSVCGRAVRDGGLRIHDELGAYSGYVPPVSRSK